MSLLLDDSELDLAMREADVAIRMHAPKQPDLVQRHLFQINWITVASPEYIKRHGTPERPEDLDNHRLILFGEYRKPVPDINWLAEAGKRAGAPRRALLEVNSLYAMATAIKLGLGIGALPNWMAEEIDGLTKVLPDLKPPKVDVFFVYPEELRNSKRVAVFRDYLLARLQELH